MTGLVYIQTIRKFLQDLSVMPAFSALQIVTDDGTRPVDVNADSFVKDVVDHLPRDWAYMNEGEPRNKTFTMSSLPAVAFTSSFTNAPSPAVAEVCSISTAMGQTDGSVSSIIFRFPPDMEDVSLLERLFKMTIAFWQPNHALVTRTNYGDALGQPVGDIRVGWMTYLKGSAAAALVPEPFTATAFEEGTLILGRHQIPGRDGVNIVPDLIRLRDALASQDLLSNPRKKKRV